ncbi:MAG: flavin reductase family protein [Paludibacteraceae bacterium]|jgi:flavin reductase (DIM6/NTAB) family NADH-FMN oxidoreductase RutF|nr:flavin reductase family protein [Paludibacteraceae bacterium]
MNKYREIKATELNENVFDLIGHQWMLVTAGSKDKYNTMTASWGAMGILFNKPIAIIFIRPQRYTFGFLEKNDTFTLSVLPETYRKALNICGSKSGKDCDKIKEAGLTPLSTELGNMAFEEARLILECKKIYGQFLDPKAFYDQSLIPANFPKNDFHKVYIAEISKVWTK